MSYTDGGAPSRVFAKTMWTYDSQRPLATAVKNVWDPDDASPTTMSQYRYGTPDNLGRRNLKERQGAAFAANYYEDYGYNARNELTAATFFNGMYDDSPTADTSKDRDWTYDPIGNRSEFALGADTPRWEYEPNAVNQYVDAQAFEGAATYPKARNYFTYDADGNLIHTALVGDANCDGVVDSYDIDAFVLAQTSIPAYEAAYPGCDPMLLDFNDDQVIDTYDIDAFTALVGGSGQGATLSRVLAYDAENRLTSVTPEHPNGNSERVAFTYDYMGRRVQKQVFGYDSTNKVWLTTPKRERRFMYADWRPVLELDGSNGVIRKYTWGRDLSGSLDAAGGIGGLVAIEDPDDLSDPTDPHGSFWVFYDANGNVGQLIDGTDRSATGNPPDYSWYADRIAAHYEYTPYGQVRSSSGAYASENPMRFSTKYWDDETGLGYWGYRYYDPVMGRWINRDPIEERGGTLLYAYVSNAPGTMIDGAGLEAITLDFNAFIDKTFQGNLKEPWPYGSDVDTDKRSYGESGTSRIRSRVTVDSKRLGCGCFSRGDKCYDIDVVCDPSIRHYNKGGMRITEEETAIPRVNKGAVIRKCWMSFVIRASAGYPFIWVAPTIDFNIEWTLAGR